MSASENVVMKVRKIKNYRKEVSNFTSRKQLLSTLISEASENACFYFMIGFS